MSTRYNTGNPIESTDVRDMSDNAKNFDEFGNSTENSFIDRLGVTRKTIRGMNAEFDYQILNMGFARVGTFATGATLTNPRHVLLWDIADGGDGQEYGWTGVFPKIVPAGSTPLTTGGIAVGTWVSRFDPVTRNQIREALSRSYAEAGYNLIAGSFESGATIVASTDVLLYELNGRAYKYTGARPHVVPSGTNPTLFPEYVDMSATLLRDDFGSKSFAADFDRSGCKIAVIPRDLSLTTGQIDVFRKTAANWWMLEQFVTGRPSGGASIDDNCQAWRLGPQLRCHNVMTLKQTTSYKDPSISSFSMIPSHFFNGGANRPTVDLLQFTGHNQSAEYTISVDMETKDIGVLFAGGPNTTDFIVSFLQRGSEIYSTTIKTQMSGGSPLLTFSRSIPNPAYGMPTDLVIRVTSNSSAIDNKYGYCGGVCCELNDIDKQADTLLYTPATNAIEFEIRPTQSGAMCYVFQEANTQLFGGESHGGETVTASAFRVNGTVATLSVDKLVVANTFDINQTGYISWPNGAQVNFNTIHGVYSKNDTTFSGRFYPSAGFTASLVYCPMLTLSSKNWRRMTYPVGIDANTLPDPKSYHYTGHLNGITMQSITNRMRAGIRFSSTILDSDAFRFEINPYADFSTKIYMGQNTQGKYRPVTAFTTEQVRFVV